MPKTDTDSSHSVQGAVGSSSAEVTGNSDWLIVFIFIVLLIVFGMFIFGTFYYSGKYHDCQKELEKKNKE